MSETLEAPANGCDGCVACCVLMGVEDLKKPAGVACRHLAGAGCGIYGDRPSSCAAFVCLWLWTQRSPAPLGPEERPDRSGVILVVAKDGQLSAHVDPARPDAWKGGRIGSILRRELDEGRPILISVGEDNFGYWPLDPPKAKPGAM